MAPQNAVHRLRVIYRHGEPLRYVGHLDLVRAWERALRRSGVPLAYSESFNPQAKLQFASALPLGATGRQEIVDVFLSQSMAPATFLEHVEPHLPAGLSLVAAEEVPLKSPALQSQLRASVWQVDVQTDLPAAEIARRIDALLAQAAATRRGKRGVYDLRPLILDLRLEESALPGWQRLAMVLRSAPAATGRPDEVVAALELADAVFRMERVRCIFDDSGS